MRSGSIMDLTAGEWSVVLSFLDLKDFARLVVCCKEFKRIIYNQYTLFASKQDPQRKLTFQKVSAKLFSHKEIENKLSYLRQPPGQIARFFARDDLTVYLTIASVPVGGIAGAMFSARDVSDYLGGSSLNISIGVNILNHIGQRIFHQQPAFNYAAIERFGYSGLQLLCTGYTASMIAGIFMNDQYAVLTATVAILLALLPSWTSNELISEPIATAMSAMMIPSLVGALTGIHLGLINMVLGKADSKFGSVFVFSFTIPAFVSGALSGIYQLVQISFKHHEASCKRQITELVNADVSNQIQRFNP